MPKSIPPMPPTDERKPGYPAGYLESDKEWFERNLEAVRWLIENQKAIRAAIAKAQ